MTDTEKRLRQHIFREDNGRIMMTVNVLDPKESTVGNIMFLMNNTPEKQLQNCLNYLIEGGYIRISGPKGEKFSGQLDDSCKDYSVILTAAGTEILMGIRENPAIDV